MKTRMNIATAAMMALLLLVLNGCEVKANSSLPDRNEEAQQLFEQIDEQFAALREIGELDSHSRLTPTAVRDRIDMLEKIGPSIELLATKYADTDVGASREARRLSSRHDSQLERMRRQLHRLEG